MSIEYETWQDTLGEWLEHHSASFRTFLQLLIFSRARFSGYNKILHGVINVSSFHFQQQHNYFIGRHSTRLHTFVKIENQMVTYFIARVQNRTVNVAKVLKTLSPHLLHRKPVMQPRRKPSRPRTSKFSEAKAKETLVEDSYHQSQGQSRPKTKDTAVT